MPEPTPEPLPPAYYSLMERLLKAGLIRDYAKPPHSSPQTLITWNDAYSEGRGGRAVFYGLASLLRDLCPETKLTPEEQAAIEALRQFLLDEAFQKRLEAGQN